MSNKENRPTFILGLAAIGLILTGIAGLIHAFMGGGAFSLLASAVAFGIVFYVCLK